MKPIDNYFLQQTEPAKSCLLFLRSHLLQCAPDVTEDWKYSMPFYYYRGTRFGYLWVSKKYLQPYIGLVDGNKLMHPALVQEKRTRMKVLLIDPSKDIPIKTINSVLKEVLALYK